MELHSYAKLRGYKKWSIQQKRKLVEARINYDGIFLRKSSNCMDSWKKIMTAAKLNDFNVCFVRKQWANLLAKYKAYKRTRLRHLGRNGEITEQIAREISEDWEFFYPIHSFMSRKPTNFHSYAQNPHDAADENGNGFDNNAVAEEHEENNKSLRQQVPTIAPNTDHDFYSKSASSEMLPCVKLEPQESSKSNLFAAAIVAPEQVSDNATDCVKIVSEVTALGDASPKDKTTKKKMRKSSEKEKYYKHKRRYDRRNEKRFDALLNVIGQMVKQHYPNVDISKLDAQSDQISTEDDNESSTSETAFMEEDSGSSSAAQSTAEAPPSDESGL